MEIVNPSRDILVHTNHFKSPALVAEEALLADLPDSARRAPRMEALLSRCHGRITLDDLKAALSDHADSPTGICRHQSNTMTIAAIIAEPEQGRLHVAAGHPCTTDFVTYTL